MSDDKPKIQIDTDWKRQAQEEKQRLAEQEAQRAAQAGSSTDKPSQPPHGTATAAPEVSTPSHGHSHSQVPPVSFATLVRSLTTQVLLYLGDLATRDSQPMVDLDMAKYQIDMLGMLEEKTQGNLSDDEKRMLDASLYEVRMRYVAVAQQVIG